MLGSHEAQGPAMCAVDGCPQLANLTPLKVQMGPATFVWLRLCSWCGEQVRYFDREQTEIRRRLEQYEEVDIA